MSLLNRAWAREDERGETISETEAKEVQSQKTLLKQEVAGDSGHTDVWRRQWEHCWISGYFSTSYAVVKPKQAWDHADKTPSVPLFQAEVSLAREDINPSLASLGEQLSASPGPV